MKCINYFLLLLFITPLLHCSKKDDSPTETDCRTEDFFAEYDQRNFKMGFTTWSFGPQLQDVNDTYQFIEDHADIYAEHIDHKIPWNAWINDLPLPTEFTNEITGRVARKIPSNELLLSVSLLNSGRGELAQDFDGSVPTYTNFNDKHIEDAYFKHINYLVNAFSPDYLVIAIEPNELTLRSPTKWEAYKLLIRQVKLRIKQVYPNLKISESISLHSIYEPEVLDSNNYFTEMANYMNQMDFVAISFYPFFIGKHSKAEFQKSFDFIHHHITKTIAFVETSHIAEPLSVPNLNLSIDGDACSQNTYLETLLTNAQEHNYEFIIWWAHRDYDALWETFPAEVKDIGKIWKDTGLLDKNGQKRKAFHTWEAALNK